MLDLRRLEALVAVARCGTVSGAALELGYGQPTVSHHLARLEAETHAVLLQRVGRGVRLTPDGEQLVARAEEILALARRAEDELAAAVSLRSGTVRLAAFPSAAATVVPPTLTALAASHPGLTVRVLDAEPPEALDLLRAGGADVALTFGYPGQEEGAEFTVTHLFDEPVCLVTPTGSPEAITDHAGSHWLAGCDRCRGELDDVCRRAGFTPTVGYASDDYVAVQSLVAAGLGVTTLPQLALHAFQHPGVSAHPISGEVRHVRAVSFGRPPRPRSVEAVVVAVADAVARR